MGATKGIKNGGNRIWRFKGHVQEFIEAKVFAVNKIGRCEGKRYEHATQ